MLSASHAATEANPIIVPASTLCNSPNAHECVATGTRYADSLSPRASQQSHSPILCVGSDLMQDRRPITPPPCVRLVITDAVTGEEINCKYVVYLISQDTGTRADGLVTGKGTLTTQCLSSMSICGTNVAHQKSTCVASRPLPVHPQCLQTPAIRIPQ